VPLLDGQVEGFDQLVDEPPRGLPIG